MSEISNKVVATMAVMALCLTACAGMCLATDDSDAATDNAFTGQKDRYTSSSHVFGYIADPYTSVNISNWGSVCSSVGISSGVAYIYVLKDSSYSITVPYAKGTLDNNKNHNYTTDNSSYITFTGTFNSNSFAETFFYISGGVTLSFEVVYSAGVVDLASGLCIRAGSTTSSQPLKGVDTYSQNVEDNCNVYVAVGSPMSFRGDEETWTYVPSNSLGLSGSGGNVSGTISSVGSTMVYRDVGAEGFQEGFTVTSVANSYTHTLAYNANGGTGAPSSSTVTNTVSGAFAMTVSSSVPSRAGYNFLGWSTNNSATSASVFAGDSVQVNGNSTLTLFAVWKQITYAHEVVFNLNGGTGSAKTLSVTNSNANHIFTVPEYSVSKPYCEFAGWSYAQNGSVDLLPGQTLTVSPNQSVTLYAVWNVVPVNITSSNPIEFLVTGNTYSYEIETDVDGASVSFNGPSWMTLNGKTLVGTPTAKGTYNVTVTATYGTMTDVQTFSVTVENRLSFESVPTGGILATPVI